MNSIRSPLNYILILLFISVILLEEIWSQGIHFRRELEGGNPGLPKGMLIFGSSQNCLSYVRTDGTFGTFFEKGSPAYLFYPSCIERGKTLIFSNLNPLTGSLVSLDVVDSETREIWKSKELLGLSFLTANPRVNLLACISNGTKLQLRDLSRPQMIRNELAFDMKGPISWHPNGQKVLCVGKDDRVCVIDLQGEECVIASSAGWPAWSPDGQQIAYRKGSNIVIYGVESRTDSTLSMKTENTCPSPNSSIWGQLSWSPDGIWIAYAEWFNVFVVNSITGSRYNIATVDSIPVGPLVWWEYEYKVP